MKIGRRTAISTSARAFIAVLLLASILGLPLPKMEDWWKGEVAEAAPSDPPPGQLQRRGIVGHVVTATSTTSSIDSDTSTSTPPTMDDDGAAITVSTKSGDVTAIITDDTIIHAPPQGSITWDEIGDGDRVAVLLERVPKSATSTGAFVESPFRVAKALKIIVIPGKATRSHIRGVVKSKVKGKLSLVDGEGSEVELDDADGLNEGDDVVLVARSKSAKPHDLEIRDFQPASYVADRLVSLIERAKNSGQRAVVKRLEKRVDTVIDQLEKRLQNARAKISGKRDAGPDSLRSSDEDANQGKRSSKGDDESSLDRSTGSGIGIAPSLGTRASTSDPAQDAEGDDETNEDDDGRSNRGKRGEDRTDRDNAPERSRGRK